MGMSPGDTHCSQCGGGSRAGSIAARSARHTALILSHIGLPALSYSRGSPQRWLAHALPQREAWLHSDQRTGQCSDAQQDVARLDYPRLAPGCQAMCWPPIGAATRSHSRCALPHLIAPEELQRQASALLRAARATDACHPATPSRGPCGSLTAPVTGPLLPFLPSCKRL